MLTFRSLLQEVLEKSKSLKSKEFFEWLKLYVEPSMQEIIAENKKSGNL